MFMTLFIAMIAFVLGLVIGKRLQMTQIASNTTTKPDLDLDQKIGDVLALFNSKEKITNNDVQAALGISDASATRYLERLEQLGVIKQNGDTGSGVYYTKKEAPSKIN